MSCRVEEIELSYMQAFAADYMSDFSKVSSFFHYSPFSEQDYSERIAELSQRSFPRQELSQIIRTTMDKWGMNEQIEKHLALLEQPNSVVVVGGQQAGLLMGPLYTIHKMITILQLAQQKSSALEVPVIPIFWVAGEDHDYDEINHIFIPRTDSKQVDKYTFKDGFASEKTSVSYLPFPQDEVREWVKGYFSRLPETEFNLDLNSKMESFISSSDSFVDFFIQISHHLFQKYGLLFIDSANPELRKLESRVFCSILNHYDAIDEKVRAMVNKMASMGYTPQVELGDYPALLFILQNGERKLLEKVGTEDFRTKDGKYSFKLDELKEIAEKSPELLSNNVITRPFMQESLFPTLAFVGGPGEISYWALYKEYFEYLGLTVPILAPRISITLIEKPIEKIIQKRSIPFASIFGEFEAFKIDWLKQQDDINIPESFTKVRDEIQHLYSELLEKLSPIPGVDQLGPKNLEKIFEQVEFLEKRSLASFSQQHEDALRQFDKVEQSLFPQQKLQERIHNPFTFINKHGDELIDQLMQIHLKVNGKHKLIYI